MNKPIEQAARFLTIVILLSTSALSQAAYVVYAVDASTDSLYTLDLNTGSTSIIGALHPDTSRYLTPVAMAIRPSDGAIYINNNSPISDNGLSTVDASTGLASFTGGGAYIDGALAFDDSGILYAADASDNLAVIDQVTGTSSAIGSFTLPRLFGLDFNSADGYLYGITGTNTGAAPPSAFDLLKIDPTTGNLVTTLALSQVLSGSAPGTLMFDWNGTLWGTTNGASSNLFQIDPLTGNVSNFLTVSNGFLPQGMGYVNTVPVPAAVWLFGSGLIGLIGVAKRRSSCQRYRIGRALIRPVPGMRA